MLNKCCPTKLSGFVCFNSFAATASKQPWVIWEVKRSSVRSSENNLLYVCGCIITKVIIWCLVLRIPTLNWTIFTKCMSMKNVCHVMKNFISGTNKGLDCSSSFCCCHVMHAALQGEKKEEYFLFGWDSWKHHKSAVSIQGHFFLLMWELWCRSLAADVQVCLLFAFHFHPDTVGQKELMIALVLGW